MPTVYWFCLGGGLVVSVALFLIHDYLGDALDGAFDALDIDGFLDPLSLVAGVSVFGGAGVLLDAYTGLGTPPTVAISVAVALLFAVGMHLVYVAPMKRSENSTAFSVREYAGRTGELTTSLTATGHGEVIVRMGASTTFQTARSFTGDPIPVGARVVVVEVTPDGTLLVAPVDEADDPPRRALPPRLS